MEKLCNFSISTRQFPTANKLLKAQKTFVKFIKLRENFVRKTTGKESGTNNKVWHILLVDSNKLEQYLEQIKTSSLNIVNYGRIIISGYEDIPKEVNDFSIYKLFTSDFVMMTLYPESTDEILYVLSHPGKKQEVLKARSIEEIECHGTILYTTNFLEPPETVSFNILRRLYLKKANRNNCQNTNIKTNTNLFDVNSINENGVTLIHQASYYGNKCIVSNLVRKGADIHKKDEISERQPAHIAALQGDIGVLEYCLNNGINVNETDGNNWTLLHFAVWNNNLKAIRFLVHEGSNINVKDKCLGKTALHVGADRGHTEAVQILLENGAKIDEGDDSGRTALYYSSWAGCLDTAKVLVKNGASIHIANYYGNKPLHVSADEGNKDMVEFFLSKGSYINNQNNDGASVLHMAAENGYLDIVLFLVNQGANVNNVSFEGETPFDYGKNHIGVASYLAIKMIKLFQSQGNLEDAYKVSNELLNIHGEQLGSDQTETLDAILNVANLLYEQGQYSKAFNILKNINTKMLTDNDCVVLRAKCELQLSIAAVQSKYEEAVEGLNGVFEKWESELGTDESDPLTVACELARGHFRKCEYDDTFYVLRNALE